VCERVLLRGDCCAVIDSSWVHCLATSVTPQEVRDLLLNKKTERDMQKDIGPSEIGGCRAKVWHRIAGTPTTNPGTLSLASNMGTAIHSWIEKTIAGNERFLLETRVERDGIVGHVDCFDTEKNEVVDWKTTKLSSVRFFPSEQQVWQVQIYGWLFSPIRQVDSVCLVMIARDGSERDIVTHVEPYSEAVALEGLEWLREVRDSLFVPRPEKKKKFCRDYCQFFDPTGVVGCPSMG
jgi:hypothetical protein